MRNDILISHSDTMLPKRDVVLTVSFIFAEFSSEMLTTHYLNGVVWYCVFLINKISPNAQCMGKNTIWFYFLYRATKAAFVDFCINFESSLGRKDILYCCLMCRLTKYNEVIHRHLWHYDVNKNYRGEINQHIHKNTLSNNYASGNGIFVLVWNEGLNQFYMSFDWP